MATSTSATQVAPHNHPQYPLGAHSSQLPDMLRYRPSLEFSLPTAPSQSTALVPYDPQDLVVAQRSPDDNEQRTALAQRNSKAGVRQTSLQSLLDFARWANDRDRACVPLNSFLQQVQDERDEAEAALEKQIVAAAASFVNSLVCSAPNSKSRSCGTSDDDLDFHSHTKDTSHSDMEDPNLASGYLPPEALNIPQQPKTSPSGELVTWHGTQKPLVQLEEEEVNEEEVVTQQVKPRKEIKRASHECVQQDLHMVSTLFQQPRDIKRLDLGTDIEATYTKIGDHISFHEKDRLRRNMQDALQALLSTAKAGDRFGIELLLHPRPAAGIVPWLEPRTRPFSGTQDERTDAMQTRPSIYEPMGLNADVVRVKMPTPSPGSPATSASVGSIVARMLADRHEGVDIVGSTTVIANPEQQTTDPSGPERAVLRKSVEQESLLESVLPEVPTHETTSPPTLNEIYDSEARETRLERMKENLDRQRQHLARKKSEAVSENMRLDGGSSQTPVKKTVTKLMARKKDQPVKAGPDHFLSLLDLVRKK